jgi:hypothetical protein
MTTDQIHKELDLIQDVIKRMAQNSFQVKAWLIGLLSALIVVSKDQLLLVGDGSDPAITYLLNGLLVLPVLCFWYLDAYFLSTERLYRELYRWVVTHRPVTSAYLYDLNTFTRTTDGHTTQLRKPKNGLWRVAVSETLLPFYLLPLAFVLGLLVYNLSRC